jgi:uncharacterized protein (DUF433 family)
MCAITEGWLFPISGVMIGKPVIVGTHIAVELILEKLPAGETVEQILEAHPRLEEDAVQAALAFAADALRAGVITFLRRSRGDVSRR